MQKHENKVKGPPFEFSDTEFLLSKRNHHSSIFFCKARNDQVLCKLKKGRESQVDEGVLYFVTEKCAKGLPVIGRVKQLKTTKLFPGQFTRHRAGCGRAREDSPASLSGLRLPCSSH